MSEFGKALKSIREALGMSQKELAYKSRLTASAISQIESGERDPSLKSIAQIVKVIPLKVDSILDRMNYK